MKTLHGAANRQRGVALIIALILVALATVLATKISFDGFIEQRRTLSVLSSEQAMQFSLGAEALAGEALTQNTGAQDTLADPWAQPTQPLPITPEDDPEGEPIGTLQGQLEDMSGRFNLNNLGHFQEGKLDPFPFEQFQRLLTSVGLETKWAAMARDWITTGEAVSQDGAKDSVYTSQTPPYRTGEFPMLSPTELMNLPGFGQDRYRKIAPYVTALPDAAATINLCTASGKVLSSLSANIGASEFGNADVLAKERATGCYPTDTTFKAVLGKSDDVNAIGKYIAMKSMGYFRLTTRITLGTSEFTLYSLLVRASGGGSKITPILRSFGTS